MFRILMFLLFITMCYGDKLESLHTGFSDYNYDLYFDYFICIVPYGVPLSIASGIKRQLTANSDPDIAKFGAIIEKRYIAFFLEFMTPYNNTQIYLFAWDAHFIDFIYENTPQSCALGTCSSFAHFDWKTVSKTLKAIICKQN